MITSSRLNDYAARGLLATVLALLIATSAGFLALHLRGEKLLSVQTASMVPTFRPGDALIVAPASSRDLRVGEIVSYRNPRNPNITVTHRLVAINKRTGWLTTSGDARQARDPSFPPNLLIGRAVALAPHFGSLLDLLRKPIGLTIAIYIPVGFIILAEIRNLSNFYARPTYNARL